MKKFAFLITVVMIGFAGAANAQMAATRDAQYIAVLRAVVNYKIDDEENIRNIERLREDRRFNEKVQKMLDKLSNNRSKTQPTGKFCRFWNRREKICITFWIKHCLTKRC